MQSRFQIQFQQIHDSNLLYKAHIRQKKKREKTLTILNRKNKICAGGVYGSRICQI